MFEKQKQEWQDMDPKWRMTIIAMVVAGTIGIVIYDQRKSGGDIAKSQAASSGASMSNAPGAPGGISGTRYDTSMMPPPSNRNQGLEDLISEMQKLRSEIAQNKKDGPAFSLGGSSVGASSGQNGQVGQNSQGGRGAASGSAAGPDGLDLSAPITFPPAPSKAGAGLDWKESDAPVASGKANSGQGTRSRLSTEAEAVPAAPTPKVWQPARVEAKEVDAAPKVIIPVNAGLEAVLLSGVAARPSGSSGGALGSAVSANSVGAPFVSRIKGDAILPNGWKLSDLGDCFLGGSAVAVLSAERAYAISDTLSCVASNGEVYEGPVKAYGLDVDGTLGLAGKVVSKQGAILFQALLTGIASGLGTALTPTPIAGLNTSAASGSSQGVQYADGETIARTAIGTGIGNATSQLSRFYLEFARETFPVIEVVAGTRITWILKESIELKRTRTATK